MSSRNYKLRSVIVSLISADELSELTVFAICDKIATADELLLADLERLDRAWVEGYGTEPVDLEGLNVSSPKQRLFGKTKE